MARRLTGIQGFSQPNPISARNLLRNGDGVVAQRGTSMSAPDVDTYICDGWVIVGESNGVIDYAQTTSSLPSYGARMAMQFTVNTANQKFGIFQPIESVDSSPYLDTGGRIHLSLSFQYQMAVSDGFADIHAAIVSWVGTLDDFDVALVSTWEDSSTPPTLGTGYAYESQAGVPTTLGAPSSTWKTAKIEGVPVDTSSVNNIGVFIWHNDTDSVAATDVLRVTNIMLNEGKKCAPFEKRSIAEELHLCERTFQKTYAMNIAPGTATSGAGAIEHPSARVTNFSTSEATLDWRFRTMMRTTPTVTVYAPTTGTAGAMTGSTTGDLTAAQLSPGAGGTTMIVSADPADSERITAHATAAAELYAP